MRPTFIALFALCVVASVSGEVLAQSTLRTEDQTILHLLDYVGVDYGGAVADGKVKSAEEYKEMVEFSGRAAAQIKALPANPKRDALVAEADKLTRLVADKAAPQFVSDTATSLRWAVIGAYNLQVSPRRAPDILRAASLYAANCAACHGAEGHGDGPAAKGLTPAPANFHNRERMDDRSAFGLYNTISLGVGGTSMAGFKQFSEDDRWALAFLVAGLGVPEEPAKQGESLWKTGEAKTTFPDLANISTLSPNEVKRRYGDKAALVQDYLLKHPEAIAADKPAPIAFARRRLAEALAAYEKGDRAKAEQLAVSAYLDGFDLAEASLDNVDRDLRTRIEREMLALRKQFGSDDNAVGVRQKVSEVDGLLSAAEEKLAGEGLSPAAAFVSALIILLREGLEAILLLAAIIAFVTKTGRRDVLPWVHTGWVAALALGALTWFIATYFINISGANREMTAGVTALVAAAMLLYVGYWLHGRSQAQAWSRFLRDQVDAALEKKTLWAMASVSFLAVYRELFEVVLFYEALWVQAGEAGHAAVGGGIAVALAVLAVTGWAIFKYSVRLPLGPFFAVMSALLALMAVVFAGQGIAALQEAGAIGINHVAFVTVPMLGIHPTLQSLGAQLLTLALVGAGAWATRRANAQAAVAGKT